MRVRGAVLYLKVRKKGSNFLAASNVYGRFLVTRIASIAPIMTMTIIIAMMPYMTVLFEAKPVAGVAVGVAVAAGELA